MHQDGKKLRIFCQHVGRGINRFGMIDNGDKVLVGVSGGKDSLSLCVALKERLRWVPIRYELRALLVEWREHPLCREDHAQLDAFFDTLEIPLQKVTASIRPPSFRGRFDCYLCSRNRKRLLFQHAERLGFRKIALGHNLDDHIETTMMELFFRGRFATMMPVQQFFGGKMSVIRPMCEVKEREIARFAERFKLPVVSVDCPNRGANQRIIMKEIVRTLSRHHKRIRENIFRSPWHMVTEYLPNRLDVRERSEE